MDIHVSKTTVREAIEFSARLRIGNEFGDDQRNEFIENTIDLLELREVQNDLVGEVGGTVGLSSDQRKRLTIAVELVAQPAVLFLDEPTSGLDSRAALRVCIPVQHHLWYKTMDSLRLFEPVCVGGQRSPQSSQYGMCSALYNSSTRQGGIPSF